MRGTERLKGRLGVVGVIFPRLGSASFGPARFTPWHGNCWNPLQIAPLISGYPLTRITGRGPQASEVSSPPSRISAVKNRKTEFARDKNEATLRCLQQGHYLLKPRMGYSYLRGQEFSGYCKPGNYEPRTAGPQAYPLPSEILFRQRAIKNK